MNLLSGKLTGTLLFALLLLLILFHILILANIIPYDIVWAGQINDSSSLWLLEGIAIIMTSVFALIIAIKIKWIKLNKFAGLINICMWLIFIFFLLNVLGNLTSPVSAEKWIFTPLTIVMALLSLRLALAKEV